MPRVSTRARALAIGGAVVVAALGAYFVLTGKAGDLPIPGLADDPPTCPLTGVEPRNENHLDRAAVALKVENAAVARPLSGLEDADLVYEELVEGGETRFMAFYHCSDTRKAGPIRSARLVDPAILMPKTTILGYSGANETVISALDEAGVASIREDDAAASGAMQRVERPGISSEHTLYANSSAIRKLAPKRGLEPPPEDTFAFGDLPEGSKKASSIALNFGGASTITYEWARGAWQRFQDGEPFLAESGDQIAPVNVLVEVHKVRASEVVDVTGTPSPEIVDETGSGKAVLFRDGRAIAGRWSRESLDSQTTFETKGGDEMLFAPGSIWIELVPSANGEVKGSFSYER
jgi:Protein of unknown function (DUF3048) N-terminal domain/Protein of unknown function (DUF3048) C-terminal domain